jgi:hypothetical protein
MLTPEETKRLKQIEEGLAILMVAVSQTLPQKCLMRDKLLVFSQNMASEFEITDGNTLK